MPPKQTKGEYIETDTGNKVSRKSVILGSQNIILGGKTIIQADCTIRGDLRRTVVPGQHSGNVAIAVGRYCFISRSSVLRPPGRTHQKLVPTYVPPRPSVVQEADQPLLCRTFSYYPMKIGDHVFVGEGSVVEAALIGSYVHIAKDCVIGKFAIIKDCVRIEEGTVIAPNTVIPSFSLVSGRPGVVIDELPETAQEGLESGVQALTIGVVKNIYRMI
ncbi:trimeric LpxA-like protein [Tuber brumale]|nr:trimeric LpxA-like protein [Tuber brumale]